jgi:hypothetical protein
MKALIMQFPPISSLQLSLVQIFSLAPCFRHPQILIGQSYYKFPIEFNFGNMYSRDSAVCVATSDGLNYRGVGVQVPVG